ncbi:MAG: Epsin-3, clathrin recruitment and traffic between the Golgi and endosome [Phylliscum demangeonii]|nr:MAG: Epsin-3, clathrin recruitment and traffic between the Golgi and endosome [Phylliscum demangeonii]
MDFSSIREQVSNLTLYDIKAGVRKVQNAVMNYTEMEAKVREATNNDPWGCSTALMQEIASATFNYSILNEIMSMIYKRFTDKAAEEWRQIYKALQLLEFLIKNGSERVIDDARAHLTLLKMLRQFHFIDANGKDQGINVRNRAKELAELLSDVERIRAERKKARATRNKYGGVEGGSAFGSSAGSSSRYGGFGSDSLSFGGYSGGVYGDGGGFGGNATGFHDSATRRDRFEEYDEYDDAAIGTAGSRPSEDPATAPTARREPTPRKAVEPPKPKAPEIDLLSVDDDDDGARSRAMASPSKATSVAASGRRLEDDDFDDFQSATPSTHTASSLLSAPPGSSRIGWSTASGASTPGMSSLSSVPSISSILPTPSTMSTTSMTSAPVPPRQQPLPPPPRRPVTYQPSQPNYFTSVPVVNSAPAASSTSATRSATTTSAAMMTAPPAAKPSSAASGDAFGSLWSAASVGVKKSSSPSPQHGPNLASMAKEKASAGIWGAASHTPASTAPRSTSSQFPASHASQASSTGGGGGVGALDDLLA